MRTGKNGLKVAEPEDEVYNPPQQGGCWICKTDNGWFTDSMLFDTEFDAWYHEGCLDTVGAESVLDYEKNHREHEHEVKEL